MVNGGAGLSHLFVKIMLANDQCSFPITKEENACTLDFRLVCACHDLIVSE